MKYPEIAKRIKEALEDSNMSQVELSIKSDVSPESINQYVKGVHKPSNISAGKIGEALGVNPMWLMGFNVSKKEALITNDEKLTLSAEAISVAKAFDLADQYDKIAVLRTLGLEKRASDMLQDSKHHEKLA